MVLPRRRLSRRVVKIKMTQVLHRSQWSNGCLRHLGPTQVDVSQLRQLGQLGQTCSRDGRPFQMQGTQMTELLQRSKAAIGDRGTCQFRLHDIRRKPQQACELSVAKFCPGIDGVQDETISQVPATPAQV